MTKAVIGLLKGFVFLTLLQEEMDKTLDRICYAFRRKPGPDRSPIAAVSAGSPPSVI